MNNENDYQKLENDYFELRRAATKCLNEIGIMIRENERLKEMLNDAHKVISELQRQIKKQK